MARSTSLAEMVNPAEMTHLLQVKLTTPCHLISTQTNLTPGRPQSTQRTLNHICMKMIELLLRPLKDPSYLNWPQRTSKRVKMNPNVLLRDLRI